MCTPTIARADWLSETLQKRSKTHTKALYCSSSVFARFAADADRLIESSK